MSKEKENLDIVPEGPTVEYSVHLLKMSDGTLQMQTRPEDLSLNDVDELVTRAFRNLGVSMVRQMVTGELATLEIELGEIKKMLTKDGGSRIVSP